MGANGPDPFALQRFITAQADGMFEAALAELRQGQKRSHWMWFIFPQHRDLGRSATSRHFGLTGVAEAAAYAAHPLLGPRLRQCCAAVLPHLSYRPAEAIFGPLDAMKLRSSMALFSEAVPNEPLFRALAEAAG